jgi:outer membrane lipoprotein-sorting protein
MNVLRRLPLYRLLILCGAVLAAGVFATAIALAVSSGPKPAPKPLPQAIHDALAAPAVEGVSANIKLTNRLLEGASLAGGSSQAGELSSNPLLAGASGRLWVSKDGRVRLELQAEKGDTQLIYDGHTITAYDAATNTLYRYTPEAEGAAKQPDAGTFRNEGAEVPSVAKIEEAISHLEEHTTVSSATPSDVAGQPTYTVRVAPRESGSLLGGAELSFDAENGALLRAAIYSSSSQSPVIELAATEVNFGPVPASVFDFKPPADAKVQELHLDTSATSHTGSAGSGEKPTITGHGTGPSTIGVLEEKLPAGAKQGSNSTLEALPKVNINGVSASELRTELGTLLSFERSGVRYVLAGAVSPAAVEALARGL